MEEYKILIDIIKQFIINEELDLLKINLERLPLEKLNQVTLDNLLSLFINQCEEYNCKNAIKIIFNVIYDLLPIESGQLDHLTRIFTDVIISNDALKMVALTYKDTKPIEYYFIHLIHWDANPITLIAAKNLDLIFNTTYNNWKYLYDISLNRLNPNILIQEFIMEKLKEKVFGLIVFIIIK
jgi:hypothetical protein